MPSLGGYGKCPFGCRGDPIPSSSATRCDARARPIRAAAPLPRGTATPRTMATLHDRQRRLESRAVCMMVSITLAGNRPRSSWSHDVSRRSKARRSARGSLPSEFSTWRRGPRAHGEGPLFTFLEMQKHGSPRHKPASTPESRLESTRIVHWLDAGNGNQEYASAPIDSIWRLARLLRIAAVHHGGDDALVKSGCLEPIRKSARKGISPREIALFGLRLAAANRPSNGRCNHSETSPTERPAPV